MCAKIAHQCALCIEHHSLKVRCQARPNSGWPARRRCADMREAPTTTAPGSQTLARGLNALQLVADAPAGMTVQQVADGIGVHRTIAYRLLAAVAQVRFLAKVQTGRYPPAAGLALLGASFDRNV